MRAKLELNKVHEFKRNPETRQFYLAGTHPALRLGCEDGALYIQDGVVFSEEGGPVDKLPGWFEQELAKCSPAALREVGWKGLTKKAA